MAAAPVVSRAHLPAREAQAGPHLITAADPVTAGDLITVAAEPVSARKSAAARTTVIRDLDPALRPVRALIRP